MWKRGSGGSVQTYNASSVRIREATVMYLRPASWAMRTASAIGRLRTEARWSFGKDSVTIDGV